MKDILIKIFVVLTFVFAFVITSRTPMMWEDVVYTLKADQALGAAMSNAAVADTIQLGRYERVQNLSDLAESTYHHYMNANGRLFPHLTSQAFGALIGKPVFDILNAVMFILLVTFVTQLVVGNRKSYWKWWVVVLSSLWVGMPESNTGFFLMTYALNYLWSSVACVIFLWIYFRLNQQKLVGWALVLSCLYAFGAGWSHEGLAVGIAASIFLDIVLDMRCHRMNSQKVAVALFFCIGAAFLCLAPGNFNRTDAALPLYNHLLSFARLRVFWVFLLSWCIFSRSIDFVRNNRILLVALVVQMAFMFYVGFRNARVLWGTEFFSLVLLLKIYADRESRGRILAYLSYILFALLFVHFGWLVYRSGEVRKQYDEIIALYLQSPDGNVYYNLQPESDWARSFIPTPLCYYRPFELTCISLYHIREQKSLHIYPKTMRSLETKTYSSPEAIFLVQPNQNKVEISYHKKCSLNPRYSSLSHVVFNVIHSKWSETVLGDYTPMENCDSLSGRHFYVVEIPQDFDGQVSHIKMISR